MLILLVLQVLQAAIAKEVQLQLLQNTYKPTAFYAPCSDPDISPADIHPTVDQDCIEKWTGGEMVVFAMLQEPTFKAFKASDSMWYMKCILTAYLSGLPECKAQHKAQQCLLPFAACCTAFRQMQVACVIVST